MLTEPNNRSLRELGWQGGSGEPSPVDLDLVKRHLRIGSVSDPSAYTDEDTLLQVYLNAAIGLLDGKGYLFRALINKDYAWDLPGFPPFNWLERPRSVTWRARDYEIRLPMSGVSAVSSITYLDLDATQQTLSSDIWQFQTDGNHEAVISLKNNQAWPATLGQEGAVTVTFTSGFGDSAAAIPAQIVTAILMMVAHMYRNREVMSRAALSENPIYGDMLSQFRRMSV